MGRAAHYLVFVVIVLSLSGCSSQLDKAQAEARLTAAHEDCVSRSLKAEVPEFEIKFEESSSGLVYYYDDQLERPFVKCVSMNLYGKDVTSLALTREDKLRYESTGGEASSLDGVFHSALHEGWDNPIAFIRFDWEEDSSYYFRWFSPSEERDATSLDSLD